ncbi:MAG: agmatinase family protein [Rikenellaceae bacterium]
MNENFDPNNLSIVNGNYFALPFEPENSDLVIISVPWDATVSYREGASLAPDAIIDASAQVDLYDPHNPHGYKCGIATIPIEEEIMLSNKFCRRDAVKVIEHLSEGGLSTDDEISKKLKRVNDGSVVVNEYVHKTAAKWLEKGKKVALVGGDHSSPLGLIKAVGEKYEGFGVLHIDAHADLREAYEGFTYSHASIMYNSLREVPQIGKLVQVGVRDFCDSEMEIIESNPKIKTFFDHIISSRMFCGETWSSVVDDIISNLPSKVYVSFDIDGLSPFNCPSTGTPVPGGISYEASVFLINRIVESGREIVGFDLCEVAPHPSGEDQWDANVGARVLFKLCNLALKQ